LLEEETGERLTEADQSSQSAKRKRSAVRLPVPPVSRANRKLGHYQWKFWL